MNTIKMLKQKIDYWNQKFNEADEDISNLPLEFQELKKSQIISKKGLINLHLRDLEDILTMAEKEIAEKGALAG